MLTGSCHCGAAGWTLNGDPGEITACNCTLCRRYGALWAYDYEGERITLRGAPRAYARADEAEPTLEILFCGDCGCMLAWRRLNIPEGERRRMAVNLRLAEPEAVAHLPIVHFDGLESFADRAARGLRVRDLWP